MTEDAITQHIIGLLRGGHFEVADDNTFFFHGSDDKFPFATIVTKDNDFDKSSNLNRPDVFRLNLGVGKETFRSLFDEEASAPVDFTAIDQLMPHPVYAKMYWISVLNPSAKTFATLKPLIAEARELAISRDKSA